MGNFNPAEYIEVADRIPLFWTKYPEGGMETEVLRVDGAEVIVRAVLYSNSASRVVLASGIAREVEGKSPVNRTSHVENAETSAIGRALANAGFTGSAKRASRQEMEKVQRQTEEHDRVLAFIRTEGAKLPEGSRFTIEGKEWDLREYVRKNWSTIKERYTIARIVAEAIDLETAVPAGVD